MFLPFPGTTLSEYAKDKGYIPCDFGMSNLSKSFFAKSNLINSPQIKQIENLQNFFQTAVLWPWTLGVVKQFIKLPPNIIFRFWFKLVYFYVHVKAERRNFLQTLVFALRNFKRLQ